MKLGAHESASGGPHRAIERAVADGCEAVQLFTKNNNRWKQRAWTDAEVELFRAASAEHPDLGLVAHSAYLINLCSATDAVCEKSRAALADEMTRCQQLGISSLVMHPGAPGATRNEWDGVSEVAVAIDAVFDEFGADFPDVRLLLENTAGQGSNLGWRYEHLRDVLALLRYVDRVGVCFDTCHAFAAGYDFRDQASYDAHWEHFDEVVGVALVEAFHLNDSKRELGSRVDRHEHPGDGEIGIEAFRLLVNDVRFAGVPALLETPPMDEDADGGYAENVAILKALREG